MSVITSIVSWALRTLWQIDSFAIAHDSEIHEATRRMLSVLLRQHDWKGYQRHLSAGGATMGVEDYLKPGARRWKERVSPASSRVPRVEETLSLPLKTRRIRALALSEINDC